MSETLSTRELTEMLNDDEPLLVVNVLEEDDYRARHIPESINIPLGEGFVEKVEAALGSKEQRVVVHCSDAECDASPTAARKLDLHGFERVYDYEGGIEAWSEADLPMEGEEV